MTVSIRYALPSGEVVDVEHCEVKETGFAHGTYWAKTATATYRYGVPAILEIVEENTL